MVVQIQHRCLEYNWVLTSFEHLVFDIFLKTRQLVDYKLLFGLTELREGMSIDNGGSLVEKLHTSIEEDWINFRDKDEEDTIH